jgi:hypothetical protein
MLARAGWWDGSAMGRLRSARSASAVSSTSEEVSPKATFSRFKYFVEHEAKQKMIDLLRAIKVEAAAYERWTLAAADPDRNLTRTEMAVYRMQAAGSGRQHARLAVDPARDPDVVVQQQRLHALLIEHVDGLLQARDGPRGQQFANPIDGLELFALLDLALHGLGLRRDGDRLSSRHVAARRGGALALHPGAADRAQGGVRAAFRDVARLHRLS